MKHKILIFIGIFMVICIVTAFKVKEGLKNKFNCKDYAKSGCIRQPMMCHWNTKKKQCRNRCDKYNNADECRKNTKSCYWNKKKSVCSSKHN